MPNIANIGIELRSILTELDSLLLGIDAYDDSSEEDEDEVQAIRVKSLFHRAIQETLTMY